MDGTSKCLPMCVPVLRSHFFIVTSTAWPQISASELPAFHAAYGALLKSSMSTLKKRDKKKEKARFEKAQLRRKILAADVEIIGPKRGAGRKKRQRQVAAAIRQVKAREKQAERDELRAKKSQSTLL